MKRGDKSRIAWVMVVVCAWSVPVFATLVPPDINGTSTATLVTGGPYDGWYLYEINIEWDLHVDGQGTALSHWDLVLLTGCASLDHLIEFDTPAGHSTTVDKPGNPEAMGWSGYFLREGDPGAGITEPVVKYNDPFVPEDAQPGEQGYGTFSFYANIIPEYGTYENALVAKAGVGVDVVYGDLTGAYPSCTIIPEPTTLLLLGLGGLALLRRRRT
ncbi:MAG: PEP-CTERM sorting domain-containing protein [Planctomycetota bacterium]